MIGEAPSWKPICQGLGLSAKAPGGAATAAPIQATAKEDRLASRMFVISPVLWKPRARERRLAGARPADPSDPLLRSAHPSAARAIYSKDPAGSQACGRWIHDDSDADFGAIFDTPCIARQPESVAATAKVSSGQMVMAATLDV